MTTQRDLDRDFRIYLDEQAVGRAPDGLLEAALAGVESTRQRPRLLVADRWRPRRLVSRASLGPRVVAVVTVVLLLIALATVLAVIGSSRRPAPPFGLAKPGLIAFDANGDLFASNPDGSGLVQLTSGPEFDDLAAYSPDGTLIAFESRQPDFSFDVFVMPADGRRRDPGDRGVRRKQVPSPGRRTAVTSRSRLGRSAGGWRNADRHRRDRRPWRGAARRAGRVRGRSGLVAGRPPDRLPPDDLLRRSARLAVGHRCRWIERPRGRARHLGLTGTAMADLGHSRSNPGTGARSPHGRRTVGGSRSWRGVSATGATCTSSTPTEGTSATCRTAPRMENGLAWSPDGTRLAYVRNPRRLQQPTRSSWSPMPTARTRAPSPAPG